MSLKEPRPIDEVQKEYQALCVRAGHIQYQIFALGKDLEVLNETLRDLNLEAAASQQSQPAAEPTKTEEAPANAQV